MISERTPIVRLLRVEEGKPTGIPLPPAVRSSTPTWWPFIGRMIQLRRPIVAIAVAALYSMVVAPMCEGSGNNQYVTGSVVHNRLGAASFILRMRKASASTLTRTTEGRFRTACIARYHKANRSTEEGACELALFVRSESSHPISFGSPKSGSVAFIAAIQASGPSSLESFGICDCCGWLDHGAFSGSSRLRWSFSCERYDEWATAS